MNRSIRTLDFNLLKALDALLAERSVTRAAQRLALTQPAVSAMLTRLRHYFDDPLFVRTQHGMMPTARALELAGQVRQIVSDIETLCRPTIFEPAAADFCFRVAATDYALKVVVLPLIAAIKTQAPKIQIAVVNVDAADLLTQFEKAQVDLALLTPETTPDALHSRILYHEHYVCILRPGHFAVENGQISLEQFCRLEHVLLSMRGQFWGATDEALAAKGLKRRVGLSLNSFLMLPEVIRQTDMVAVVPYRLVADCTDLAVVPPPLPITGFSKSMAWHDRTHHDAAHQWLRSLCLNVCGQAENGLAETDGQSA